MKLHALSATATFALALATSCALSTAGAQDQTRVSAEKLIRAYPDVLERFEDGTLIWRDGTRMAMSDGVRDKPFEAMLDAPDLDDMLAVPYPKQMPASPPLTDPGRARNAAFFQKMYGDCTRGGLSQKLVRVNWLPRHGGGTLFVTKVNGVDQKLRAISDELSNLPPALIRQFLIPPAGAYNCRRIAGVTRESAHGYGIAIDIALRHSDYWRWSRTGAYRNRVPTEIVAVFEKHGFIWGGKWKSFDTMHFEYRPELLID